MIVIDSTRIFHEHCVKFLKIADILIYYTGEITVLKYPSSFCLKNSLQIPVPIFSDPTSLPDKVIVVTITALYYVSKEFHSYQHDNLENKQDKTTPLPYLYTLAVISSPCHYQQHPCDSQFIPSSGRHLHPVGWVYPRCRAN